MKKNHSSFVQLLYMSIQKSYSYCSFLDKNDCTVIYDVLKVYRFYTIKINLNFKI